MNIQSTRPVQTAKFQKTASPSPDSKENSTFHNEPHVPMDAVMRGYRDLDFSMAKEHFAWAALGAASGAAGGALGNGGWTVATTMGTGAAFNFGAAVIEAEIRPDPMMGIGLIASPIVGAATGAVSGALGYGLSALTGVHPAITGAVTGAATGLALSLRNS